LKLVVTAGTMRVARSFKLDRVFGRDKPLPETKIALQTSGDFIGDEYLRETGLLLFPR
jgi:hypothetical protein